jgi:hypothetical protein
MNTASLDRLSQSTETSPEIITAIAGVLGDNASVEAILHAWRDPFDSIAILDAAWNLADTEEDALYWGEEAYARPLPIHPIEGQAHPPPIIAPAIPKSQPSRSLVLPRNTRPRERMHRYPQLPRIPQRRPHQQPHHLTLRDLILKTHPCQLLLVLAV